MAEPILIADKLSKTFSIRGGFWQGPAGKIEAVKEVSCELSAGQTLGLVGESGCGKSTLAKLLVGLLEPTSGEVRLKGQLFSKLKGSVLRMARRSVQLIFQNPTTSLNPRMRVESLLSEPLIIHRFVSSRTERVRRVEALLDRVQLPAHYRRRFPHELSGGERQRIGIARALAVEPQILICDEPIASLDISVGSQILQLLKQLHETKKMALVFISHDLGAVSSLCERIAVMQQGRLVEIAPTTQILKTPQLPYTQLLLRCAKLDLDVYG